MKAAASYRRACVARPAGSLSPRSAERTSGRRQTYSGLGKVKRPKNRMPGEVNSVENALSKPTEALIAYLVHLLVPILLLLDELVLPVLARVDFVQGPGDKILVAVSVLWLLVGLGALLLWRNQARFLLFVRKPLLSFYTVLLLLPFLELFGRVVWRKPSPYPGVWIPGTKLVTRADPLQTPGVSGIKRFTVNEIGLRAPSLPLDGNPYRIVTVGGSTTACVWLDDSEEWPHLVMEGMNSRQNKRRVWVGNAAVSGHTTVHHLVALQKVPIFNEADLVVFLIGVNDLSATLSSDGAPTQRELEYDAAFFSTELSGGQPPRYPLFKRLRLFELVHQVVHTAMRKFSRPGQEIKLNFSDVRRRRAAGRVAPLPDLRIGLAEYCERILGLVRECEAHRARCLFLTQPSMWRADLPLPEQRLLFLGGVGPTSNPKGYVGLTDTERAMNAYNSTLLDVCRRNGLECYDLASRVPKDSVAFFDDVHFTESGARIVARLVVDYLLSTPPFAEASKSPPGQ